MDDQCMDWKIVLIDDEADIRDVVAIDLTDAGYQVFTAENGEAGLALFDEVSAQIVITDIRMPEMNGIEVLSAIKKKAPNVQVIVVTAYGELDFAVQALQLDASDFISKPINPDTLHLAVKRARERYLAIQKIQDYTRLLEQDIRNQACILHQDKMMSLGRLAASVVHEMNNPLSGILNYLRLMAKMMDREALSPDSQEKFKGYLELMIQEVTRCSAVVSGLLNFSRRSEPDFDAVSIEELLGRCMILVDHKLELSHIERAIHLDEDLPPVRGDIHQLQQCVVNLVFNAVDAMPRGGRLTIRGACDANRENVVLSFADTGGGIEPQNLSKIFDPFFTTKQEGHGVGLGLSTVFGIMERHRGSVDVESRPGEGATFRLKLPVQA